PPKFRPIPAPAWSTEVDPPPVTAANNGASTSGIAAATKIMTMPIADSIQLPPSDDSTKPNLITTAAIGLAKTRPNITPDHREKIALDPSNETANIAAGMNTVKIKMPTRRKTIIKISTRQTNQMTKPSRKLTSTRPTSPSWTAHFHWT